MRLPCRYRADNITLDRRAIQIIPTGSARDLGIREQALDIALATGTHQQQISAGGIGDDG